MAEDSHPVAASFVSVGYLVLLTMGAALSMWGSFNRYIVEEDFTVYLYEEEIPESTLSNILSL